MTEENQLTSQPNHDIAIEPGPFTLHVFVCTNTRESKESCGQKGAERLRGELKDWAKREFGRAVRINTAGCLDRCNRGIAVAAYPKNEWALDVRADDLSAIQSTIRNWFDQSKKS
jgi:predicted metal-binding protein